MILWWYDCLIIFVLVELINLDKQRRLTQEENDIYDESELVKGIYDYSMNYDVPIVELTRIQNYGLVYRDNQATIVLLDSGFNDDIYQQHYSR